MIPDYQLYKFTRITMPYDECLAETRALVAYALPTLKWRHHAIGALQGYIAEDREPEVRVHIWHPDLVRVSNELDAGRPHDHRFDMRSTVLAGSIGHEELNVSHHPHGNLVEYVVQHARKGPAPLSPTGLVYRARRITRTIQAGYCYEFPARKFHRSFVPEPAVTLVTKLAQTSEPARVLFPKGADPVFGVHPFDPKEAERYVAIALEMLKK